MALGETISERAGVVNLSINGTVILAAMVGFVSASITTSVFIGVIVATAVGGFVALILVVLNIELKRDQFAIGFVLTVLCSELAQLLGTKFTHVSGPIISSKPIPLLSDIPIIGPVFFNHDWTVYLSYVLTIGLWFWLFQTSHGLGLRAIGEKPEVAFFRGININLQRYIYTVIGGSLVGLAGAAYSLKLKPGWTTPPCMDGEGWIALAIVVFGGWHPLRVMFGAYLFAILRTFALSIQRSDIEIAVILLNVLPWLLMISALIIMNSGIVRRLTQYLPHPIQRQMRVFFFGEPPKALGTRFDPSKT